jgi:hypothetical protein
MLDQADLHALERWCAARRVTWAACAHDAVLLRGAAGPPARLCPRPDGWALETEAGEALAAASTLPALLDAMDAGLAVQ